MKVYVSELPKSCWECIFADNQKGYCDLQETRILRQFTKRDSGCPLQSLADYTKQMRKEVCEEIRKEFEPSNATKIDENVCTPTNESMLVANGFKSCKRRLFKKLDEIQGE